MKNKVLFTIFLLLYPLISSFSQTEYGYDLNGVLALPTGKNAKFYNVGFGAVGGFYFGVESNMRVGISTGFIRSGINVDEINKFYSETDREGTYDLTGSISTIPVLVSFKIIAPENNTRVYGVLEGGLYNYWSKATGTLNYETGSVSVDESEFRSEAGLALGMGVNIKMNDLILDINFKYHFIKDSEYLNVDQYSKAVSTSQMITFGIGLNWNYIN